MKLKTVDNYVTLNNLSTTYAKVEVVGKCLDSSSANSYKIIATYQDSTTSEISVELPINKQEGTQEVEFDGSKTIVSITVTGIYTASKNLGLKTLTVTTGSASQIEDTEPETEYFTVSFDTLGGNQINAQQIEKGKTATKPSNPTKSGYNFVYWTFNNLEYDFSSPITQDITLTAKWEENPQISQTSTYLNGILYGDDDFVAKIKNCSEREVQTVNDIPSDAIFVSPSGSDSNSGTQGSPLLTLQKALSKASSQINSGGNGVIIMREGTYGSTYFYDLAQGNKDHYVTITNYPGETVKISAVDSTGLFHLGTSNYLIIEGLIFCDNVATSAAKGITASGNGINHIIIKNNEFYNIRVSALDGEHNNGSVISFRGTKQGSPHNNFLIYNNNIHDCTTGWSEALTFVGNCEYINVINNTIKDTGNIGIDIAGNWGDVAGTQDDQARYVVVRGNDVSMCNSPYARSYALYCDGARDVIFENNRAHDSQGGIEIGSENRIDAYPVKNIIIRNNLVYNNSEKGIAVGGYNEDVAGFVKNVEIYNNTVVNNGEASSGQISITMVDTVSIYNNVFYVSDASYYIVYESSSISAQNRINVSYNNNLYYSPSTSESALFKINGETITGITAFSQIDNNAIYSNPQFKNVDSLDFSLTSSSPAIDSGVTASYALYDLDGKTRIQGSKIDLGCFEFSN